VDDWLVHEFTMSGDGKVGGGRSGSEALHTWWWLLSSALFQQGRTCHHLPQLQRPPLQLGLAHALLAING
jgi:hypothetical protein